MDADAGPCQAWPGSSEVTELNAFAAELNSLPIPSQAAAASNIGPVPGPSSSSTELTSGGHTEKLITAPFDQVSSSPCSNVPHRIVRQSQLGGEALTLGDPPKGNFLLGSALLGKQHSDSRRLLRLYDLRYATRALRSDR